MTMTLPGPQTSETAPAPPRLPSGAAGAGATPEQWRDRLEKELDARRAELDLYDAYYRGVHRAMFAGEKFRTTFGNRFLHFADNWCPLVVDAVEERTTVQGFRFGDDPKADEDAHRIWQENDLDAYSQIAHTEALIGGESSVLVAPPAVEGGDAVITIEHASQMVVAHARGNRRRRLAALKKWVDDDGHVLATLYLPGEIFKWRSARPQQGDGASSKVEWQRRAVAGETWPMVNAQGVVPVIPLMNSPRLLTGGMSELRPVVPLQDAINKLVIDMLTASEFAAFPQRWVTGIDIPVDPATNQPMEPFRIGVDRLLVAEEQGASFGSFPESQLAGYVTVIEKLVQHVATLTRTPPHYFYLGGNFPSGESIKSAEAGLVAKARRKMRHFGEAWEQVIRLAFLTVGDPRAAEVDAETIWADPEYRTEGEHVDALLKMKSLGVPNRALQERAGFSPKEMARFDAMIAEEQLVAGAFAPDADGAPASTGPDVKAQADALGILIRSGADPDVAARLVGLAGLQFTGAVPTTLRLPESEAADLESPGGGP